MTTLTITNRTTQNFVVCYATQPPLPPYPGDRRSLLPGGQGTYTPDNSSNPAATTPDAVAAANTANINFVIADLARFGMVPDTQADAFNASRNPLGPPWSGLSYTVSS